jgi:hypothetical protein
MRHAIEYMFLIVGAYCGMRVMERIIRARIRRAIAKGRRKYRKTFGPPSKRMAPLSPRTRRSFVSVRCQEGIAQDDPSSHAGCNAKTCECVCGHPYRNRPRPVVERKPERKVVVDDDAPPFAIGVRDYYESMLSLG